jgi:uncharacterized membrane protein YedE/YeeE
MCRIQFRLWHLMATIGMAALMAAGWVWLFTPPPTPSDVVLRSDFWVTLNIAGYEIPHTSPIFWLIVGILLAALLGIFAGCIRALVWATRAFGHARSRNG